MVLDVALFIPNLLNGLGSMIYQKQIPEDILLPTSTVVLALPSASIFYSQASSLLGVMPVGIPGVSAFAVLLTLEELDSRLGQNNEYVMYYTQLARQHRYSLNRCDLTSFVINESEHVVTVRIDTCDFYVYVYPMHSFRHG